MRGRCINPRNERGNSGSEIEKEESDMKNGNELAISIPATPGSLLVREYQREARVKGLKLK